MKCSLCTKTALRHVHREGFCKDHLDAAFTAQKKINYYIAVHEYDQYSKRKDPRRAWHLIAHTRTRRIY